MTYLLLARNPSIIRGLGLSGICFPPKLPRPLGISLPCRRKTDPRHGQHPQKFITDQTCRSGDILMERQTEWYTDILIAILAHPLRGFARRWMHRLLYHASGNHKGHYKPFNTNFSTFVYLQMDHYNSQRLSSSLTLCTSLTQVFSANVHRYHSNNSYGDVHFGNFSH